MRIQVDGRENLTLSISPAEYASTDWGNSADDFVYFHTEEGRLVVLNLSRVGAISIASGTPPTGSNPGWRIHAGGPYGAVDAHITQATKDALDPVLESAGDIVLEFTTIEGTDVKVPLLNTQFIVLTPEDLVIPT